MFCNSLRTAGMREADTASGPALIHPVTWQENKPLTFFDYPKSASLTR
jgi:hypothetical protein